MTEKLMELKNEGITGDVVVPSEYWNDQGPVPVKFTVMFVGALPQIVVVPAIVAVGLGVRTTLIGVVVLAHPELLLLTVKDAL